MQWFSRLTAAVGLSELPRLRKLIVAVIGVTVLLLGVALIVLPGPAFIVIPVGLAILATELNVPIVPVALDGPGRVWPRKSRRVRLAKVKISFGEPINARAIVPDETDEEVVYEKVTAVLKQRIQQMLDEMRSGN